eukprot:1395460-Amorphochlora_amoeboformis.AAC.1
MPRSNESGVAATAFLGLGLLSASKLGFSWLNLGSVLKAGVIGDIPRFSNSRVLLSVNSGISSRRCSSNGDIHDRWWVKKKRKSLNNAPVRNKC